MTPDEFIRKFYQQDSMFAEVHDKAQRLHHAYYPNIKWFLYKQPFHDGSFIGWNGVFVDIVTKFTAKRNEFADSNLWHRAMEEILYAFNHEIYPAARAAGIPASYFVFDDISLENIAGETAMGADFAHDDPGLHFEHAEGTPPEIMAQELEHIRDHCEVSLDCDDNECALTVSCETRDGQSFSKTVDLKPLIVYFGKRIRDYHHRLHGEDIAIAGFGDWIAQVATSARKVAESSAGKELLMQVATTAVPGLEIAMKMHEQLDRAQNGDPIATAKIAAVKNLADQGDPKAQYALNTAKIMNEAMKMKASTGSASAYQRGLQIGASHHKKKRPSHHRTSSTPPPTPSMATPPGYDPTPELMAAQQMMDQANQMQQVAEIREAAEMARQQAEAEHIQALSMQEAPMSERDAQREGRALAQRNAIADQIAMLQQQAGGYGGDPAAGYYDQGVDGYGNPVVMGCDPLDTEIAGWLYNRPYRTPAEAVLGVANNNFPGVGISLRELYNSGLGK